ncbi:MAG: GNAT family N-acetyltransferase [Hyphomicrobiaceae bacterium]
MRNSVHQSAHKSTCVNLLDGVDLRPIDADDWSRVRELHTVSFDRLGASQLGDEHVAAFKDLVSSPEYTAMLQQESLCGAWVDGFLAGTCGWVAANDAGNVARLTSLFVHPLFTRMGLGQLLVADAEQRARNAGFQTFAVRALPDVAAFFARLDYEVTSHGVMSIMGPVTAPVVFLRKSAHMQGMSPRVLSQSRSHDGPRETAPDAPHQPDSSELIPRDH